MDSPHYRILYRTKDAEKIAIPLSLIDSKAAPVEGRPTICVDTAVKR